MARPGLTKHRKFLRLARRVGGQPLALGCLELMWEKCYESGDDYLGESIDVEAAAQWAGTPGELCEALLTAGGEGNCGFIDEIAERPGHYRCHDLFDHAPSYVADRRAREIQRKAKGISLSQIPADAGRKGAAVTNAKRSANDSKRSAPDQQFATTPAPAPAQENPLSEQDRSDVESPVTAMKAVKAPSLSEEASQLAAKLKGEILRNKSDFRVTPAQERNWAVIAQRMIEIDKRDPREIADVIEWAQRNEFWMSNILSMEKVRTQFDALQLKRKRSIGPTHAPTFEEIEARSQAEEVGV